MIYKNKDTEVLEVQDTMCGRQNTKRAPKIPNC